VPSIDTTVLVSAFADQSAALLDWAGTLTPAERAGTSTLEGRSVTDVLAHLSISAAMVAEGAGPAGERPRRGSTALLRTRLVELVVHGRDLSRSLPNHPPPLLPAAVRIVTKALADAMAEQHPGRAVELRVPPYAAVQLLEGGSHTRGTPPNVVETDPMTFIDLASGRVTFAAAVESGAVRASGIRADLGPYLPVLT